MLSKSIWTCLFTCKICFSAGLSAFQRSNSCFRSHCCGLSDIFMSLAVPGAGNRNRHCLNFQGYLGCADLLSQVVAEWVFLLLPNIPEQGGSEMMGIYQSRWKWLFTCWKGEKSLDLVLRILTKVSGIWINTASRVKSLEVHRNPPILHCHLCHPSSGKLKRYFNKNHGVLPIF